MEVHSWKDWIEYEFKQKYLRDVFLLLKRERSKFIVYPKFENIFRAFTLCPMERLKVVILGQDPYPQPGVADGLAFSTQIPGYMPETLKIIFREVSRSLHPAKNFAALFESCDLSWWAEQGVLLLNTSLTVREGQSGSHAEVWEKFIGKFILLTNMFQRPIVFMLWGNKAKAFRQFIKDANYSRKVLTAVHPVAESRGSGQFVGCNHFKECNNFLEQYYGKNGSVDWRTYKNGEFPFPVEWQNFKLI